MAEKRISEHEDILAKPSKTEKQRGKKKYWERNNRKFKNCGAATKCVMYI